VSGSETEKIVRVRNALVDPFRYRWYGSLLVEGGGETLRLPMTGTVAQWLRPGEELLLELLPGADPQNLSFESYRLWRALDGKKVQIWPLFRRGFTLERRSPTSGEMLYTYAVEAREAGLESDYEAIVELEQHHYAAEEELLARWWCPEDGTVQAANARPFVPGAAGPCAFPTSWIRPTPPAFWS
jgi:ABC-type ATPase with predicted acetyltransferase domain